MIDTYRLAQPLSKLMPLPRFSLFIICLISILTPVQYLIAEDQKQLTLLGSVQQALSLNPNIQIAEQQTNLQKGQYRSAQGQFDVLTRASVSGSRQKIPLNSSDREDAGFSHEAIDTYQYQAGVEKQFRQGVSLSQRFLLEQESDNALNPEGANRGGVKLTLTVPLLKGLGERAVGALERAAALQYNASLYALKNQTAKTIQSVVSQYWDFKAAAETLRIRENSERLATQAIAQLESLVKKGKRNQSDLEHAKANLADRISTRRNAEFTLQSAQHQLGLSLGIPYDTFQNLPIPSDTFPNPKHAASFTTHTISHYLTSALKHRSDLKALKKQERAAMVLIHRAKNNTLPQLDLSVSGGYEGLVDGKNQQDLFRSLNTNVMGANTLVSLTYEFPAQNRSALGQLAQQRAQYQQVKIKRLNLERTIQSKVRLALEQLRTSSESIVRSKEAVASFRKTYAEQVKQFEAGTVDFIVLVEGEENLASARIRYVTAQQQYASALIALRFESAALLSPGGTEIQHQFSSESLRNLPSIEDLRK